MDKFLVPAGIQQARVINYRLEKSTNGYLQVKVTFKLVGDGSELDWYGTFKEGKAAEIAIKSVLTCGFKKDTPLSQLDNGAGSGVLDETRIVNLQVEHEEYPVGSGEKKAKVAWVNSLDGRMKKINESEKASLSQFDQMVGAMRIKMGIKDEEMPF